MAPKVATPKGTTGADEDVKFLLTIIKQLEGTPNWRKVAEDLNLPSKGAASKRYSRLPGKYNISMDKTGTPSPAKKAAKGTSVSPDAEEEGEEDAPKKSKAKPKAKKAAASNKKRKVSEVDEEDEIVKSEVESDN